MERRCVGLVLAMSLLPSAIAAQTREEIADAIKRLDGPREDARAIEFLIDAGRPAVEPIIEALRDAPEDPGNPRFTRMLRVLRALGPEATSALPVLVELLTEPACRSTPAGVEQMGDVARTTGHLVLFSPEQAPELTRVYAGFLDFVLPRQQGRRLDDHLDPWLLLRSRRVASDSGTIVAAPRLGGSDVWEREMAAELIGPARRDAIPLLVAMLDDDSQPTRARVNSRVFGEISLAVTQTRANTIAWDAASMAIARIDPEHPKALRGLALMVAAADDPRDRVRAAAALGCHGEAAAEYVHVLYGALRSEYEPLVAEAVTAVGMIGTSNYLLLTTLRGFTTDDRPAIAARAKAAVRALQKRDG